MRPPRKPTETERGTQIVELAIVLPLLLFLSLAVSEGADMIRAHQVLNNAAREGARLAVQRENYDPANPLTDCGTANITAPKTSHDALCQAIASYAQNNGISQGAGDNQCNGSANADGLNITINQQYLIPSASGGASMTGTQVTVICPYNLSFLPRIPGFGLNGAVNLRGNVIFRNLGF